MNEKGLKEQLKLSKKQNKETRYNYIAKSFNSIDYAMELEKYIFKLGKEKQELIDYLKEQIKKQEHKLKILDYGLDIVHAKSRIITYKEILFKIEKR